MTHTFKLEAGRTIYRDGKPFIAIQRCGDTEPADADQAARDIAATTYRCDYSGRRDKYAHAEEAELQIRDLLIRAIGAIENPDDLTAEEVLHLLDDLQSAADQLSGQEEA